MRFDSSESRNEAARERPDAGASFDARVAAVAAGGYTELSAELSDESNAEPVAAALNRAAGLLGWADEERGPLARVVPRGSRVVVKPNLVLHENQGPWGMEPLVTHPSLIRAAVEAALRAGAAEVLVGDAPIQGCDFGRLLEVTGLGVWAEALAKAEPRFKGIRDFRRTTCTFVDGVRVAVEDLQPEDNFVLFDLGGESLLEPVTDGRGSFRVTCYDQRLLARTHAPGRHQYLVAREILEADVVINLPKLKTHKKAGVTCALKNLIGINGNKEYLPHHRVGGSALGGDCYEGLSPVKRAVEFALDRQNTTKSLGAGRVWRGMGAQLERVANLLGDVTGTEGSWSGNDTIWRTCLDLNRVLLYGRADASMADEVQRRVLHLVDAVVAGQGNGPLAPEPLELGLLLAGASAPALDWVGALLLGYDPERIPVTREAFGRFRWPLVTYTPDEVMLAGDVGEGSAAQALGTRASAPVVNHPTGWRDASARGANDEGASCDVENSSRRYARENIVE